MKSFLILTKAKAENLITREKKAQFKVFALVLVYVLRMAFFQSIFASPHIAKTPSFKLSLAQHQSKNLPHLPVAHRSHTQKHTTCNAKAPAVVPLDGIQFTSFVIKEPSLISTLKFYNNPVYQNRCSDAYKRYRLCSIFLI